MLPVAFEKNPTELPHYGDSLVVCEGVLDLTAPGVGAKLNQEGARLTGTVPIPEMTSSLAR